MDKLFTFALAIAVSAGTTAVLASNRHSVRQTPQPSQSADVQWSTDGAFRDGLYLGKLSARTGRPLRPPVGRWSTEKDRSSFLAGYRRGYDDFLAAVKPVGLPGAE